MTIGRKYAIRSKHDPLPRVLDQRTRAVLNAIGNEPKGKAVDAYLMALLEKRVARDQGNC